MSRADFVSDVKLVRDQIDSPSDKAPIISLLSTEAVLGADGSQMERSDFVTMSVEKAFLWAAKANSVIKLGFRDGMALSVIAQQSFGFRNIVDENIEIFMICDSIPRFESNPFKRRIITGVLPKLSCRWKEDADPAPVDLNHGAKT
jgi:hypothetical protein